MTERDTKIKEALQCIVSIMTEHDGVVVDGPYVAPGEDIELGSTSFISLKRWAEEALALIVTPEPTDPVKVLTDEEIEQIVIENHTETNSADCSSYEEYHDEGQQEIGRRLGIKEGLEIARDNNYLSPAPIDIKAIMEAVMVAWDWCKGTGVPHNQQRDYFQINAIEQLKKRLNK